jgi:SH3 domain protein
MLRFPGLLAVLFPLLLVGIAHSAHITDKLVVGLYAAPKIEGTPLQLLSSGMPLEVLRRKDGFAEVRLGDDQTGWVEADYVTEEKPAKAMLLETQARLRLMGLELAKLREQSDTATPAVPAAAEDDMAVLQQALEQSASRIVELEAALAERDNAGSAQQQLDRLNAQVREMLQQLAKTQGLSVAGAETATSPGLVTRYREWIIGAAALLFGFAAGILFIDYRFRRRHGGFRL